MAVNKSSRSLWIDFVMIVFEIAGYAFVAGGVVGLLNNQFGRDVMLKIGGSRIEVGDDPYVASSFIVLGLLVIFAFWITSKIRFKVWYTLNKSMLRTVCGICALLIAVGFGYLVTYLEGGAGPQAAIQGDLQTIVDIYKTADTQNKKISDEDERTMLLNAAQRGHTDIVNFLLTQGVAPDTHRDDGLPVSHVAMLWGDPDSVRALLDAGADIHARSPSNGNTLLMDALARTDYQNDQQQIDIVSDLVAAGSDLDAKDDFGNSVVDLASRYNLQHLVQQ